MKKIKDKTYNKAKKRFYISLIFLLAGIVYLLSPIDLIPDVLGPIGWVDDISALFIAFVHSAYTYLKVKKIKKN